MKKQFVKSIPITLFSIILNFGFKIFLTNLISKEELALYFTIVDIFSLVLMLLVGFRSSMVVYYARLGNPTEILNILRYFTIALLALASLVVLPYLKWGLGVTLSTFYLLVMVLSMGLSLYFGNQLAMYRLYKTMNHVTILEPLFAIGWFLAIFYLSGSRGIEVLILSSTLGALCISIYIYLAKRKEHKEPLWIKIPLGGHTREFLKNSLLSSLEFGFGMLMTYLAVFFILNHYTLFDLADFQVVVKSIFMYFITLFVFPVFRFILPELSLFVSQKQIEQIARIKRWVYRFSFGVSTFFVGGTLFFGKDLIALFFPAQYIRSFEMLLILSPGSLFAMLNAYQLSFIKACGKFALSLQVRIFGILVFAGTFFGVKLFYNKPDTVIIGLVAGYAGMYALSLFIEKRLTKELTN